MTLAGAAVVILRRHDALEVISGDMQSVWPLDNSRRCLGGAACLHGHSRRPEPPAKMGA